MTSDELNNAIQNGNAERLPELPATPISPAPTSASLDEYLIVLNLLRKIKTPLSAVPTFTPQNFLDQIQFVDDGVSKTLYVYINGVWTQAGGGGVAGSDQDIQFNDGGVQGADSDFKWDKTNKELKLGADTSITTADGGTGQPGKGLFVSTGHGDTGQLGGEFSLFAPDGAPVGISAGPGNDSYPGGDFTAEAGAATGTNCKAGDYIIRVGRGNGTGKSGRVVFSSNVNDAKSYKVIGTAVTTDATPQTLAATDFPTMASTSALFIQARILARRVSGTAGSDDDSAAYVRRACYKRVVSAAPTLVGSVQDDFTVEDQAGWDATFVVSGNDVVLQVTGATNNTIRWRYEITYIIHEF